MNRVKLEEKGRKGEKYGRILAENGAGRKGRKVEQGKNP